MEHLDDFLCERQCDEYFDEEYEVANDDYAGYLDVQEYRRKRLNKRKRTIYEYSDCYDDHPYYGDYGD